MILNSIMVAEEVYEMTQKGKEYWKEVWNYLDLSGYILSIVFLVGIEVCQDTNIFYKKTWVQFVLMISLISLGLRAITQLGYFTWFRSLIELIKQTLFDMIPFLSLLALVVILMTIVNLVPMLKGNEIEFYTLYSHFFPMFGDTYQIIFGENPDPKEMTIQMWMAYIMFTILVNITCLNLLIAILSNTYDNVQVSLDSTNCKKKAEII